MKKRVLSLLLLVVMLVSAVPLFAFVVAAQDTEVTEEEFDYNSLYAGYDEVIYHLDFFKLNSFWGGELPDVPDAPADTFVGQKIVDSGDAPTAAYKAAVDAYKAEMKTLLESFVVRKSGSTNLLIKLADMNGKSYNDVDGSAQKANFTFENGYIKIRTINGNTYLNFDKVPSDGIVTGEYVMTGGEYAASMDLGQLVLMRELPVGVTVANGDVTFTKFSAYGTNSAEAEFEDFTAVGGAMSPFTMAVESDRTDGANNGSIWLNGESKVTDVAVSDPNHGNVMHIGWSNSMNSRIYAIRVYARALSEAEQAQNRFADLCKWYKLDMALYTQLSTAEKAEAQAALIAAANEAGAFMTEDDADRTLLQSTIDEFALDAVYGKLTADDTSAKAAEFAAIARALRVDISGVLVLAVDYRTSIYDIVINRMGEVDIESMTDTDRAAAARLVQALINEEIETIVAANYGGLLPETNLTYKDLYVRQDNMVVWADFFASKASDGLLYMDYSYDGTTQTAWNQTNSGTAKKDGTMVANWNLPHKRWNPATNKWTTEWNPDKIRNSEVSGEAAAIAKYAFKGGGLWNDGARTPGAYLYFADIPDHSWGHSNIRQWGDGCLIGDPNGKPNNSWRIFSPGANEEQITYQYVMGWGGGGNVQLDGFRMSVKIDKGLFSVTDYTYYGYGVSTDGTTLSNNANMIARPVGASAPAQKMADFTVTLDKNLGEDPGHYYEEVYQTNTEGAIRYRSNILELDLYRYETADGIYLVDTTGGNYVARFSMNVAGMVFYITDADGAVVETLPLVKNGDVLTANWDAATLAEEDEDRPSTPAIVGPYYQNPFVEVEAGTLGATGPIVYAGTYDMTVYGNGQEILFVPNLSYQASDIGWVGNGSCLTTYAIRTYNCILSEAEIHQNHFADLAGFYGLDLSAYTLLSATERLQLHKDLIGLELGFSKAEGIAAYEKALDKYLYDFDMDVEGAEHFLTICHNFGLDTRAVKELSDEAQERIFAKFADVDPDAKNYPEILQSMVNAAVTDEITNHYASAYGHQTIAFDGWQIRQTGAQGMRAMFSTDLYRVYDLEARGAKVQAGVLVAKKDGAIASPADLRVTVGTDGSITAPDGVTLVQGYWDGTVAEGAVMDGMTLSFTKETILNIVTDATDDRLDLDEDDLADPDAIASAIERANRTIYRNEKYIYVGFTVVTAADGTVSTFYEDATLGGKADAYALYDIVHRARTAYKMAAPNIQAVANTVERTSLISGQVAARPFEQYKLVLGADAESQARLQNTIAAALGFSLDTIRRAEVTDGLPCLYIGAYDNFYASDCYGVSVHNGNIYLWFNADADASDAVALFADYIAACHDEGTDFAIATNFEIVRRAIDAPAE